MAASHQDATGASLLARVMYWWNGTNAVPANASTPMPITDAANGTLSTFTYDARKFPTAQGLVQRFRDQDQNPEGFTLYAYAAVQALAAAAEATGTMDSTRLAEWLRGGNRFDTVVGPVTFDARGDLTNPAVAWFKWIDGRYVEIDPKTLAPPVLDTTP